jgi:hypothetical protein
MASESTGKNRHIWATPAQMPAQATFLFRDIVQLNTPNIEGARDLLRGTCCMSNAQPNPTPVTCAVAGG